MPTRSALLAEDETDLRLFPPPPRRPGLTRPSRPGGDQRRRRKRVLFGSINILTGHRLFLVRRHQRGDDCEAFLDEVHER